jgi:AraC-like DNA-binding protein
MNRIPIHEIDFLFPRKIAALWNYSDTEHIPAIDHAHRHDYYIFLFMEKGRAKLLIDFMEYEHAGPTVMCILPGQVHLPLEHSDIAGWFLAVDAMLVDDEYKAIFEKFSFLKNMPELSDDNLLDLKYCVTAMHRRLKPGEQFAENSIVRSLFSAYIGMIAEIYQKGLPASVNNRCGIITSQFKSLLSANYRTIKNPSQYALQLNISPVYLNEAVKKTTGRSASWCIQKEIMTQAKRLLFYTGMSVKEIAIELGYDDYAYFTRLFTKESTLSPVQFRKKYLK